jgi:hypothetical protein
MRSHVTKPACVQPATEALPQLFDNWFDPIETGFASGCANSSRRWWKWSLRLCCRGRAMSAAASHRTRRRAAPRGSRGTAVAIGRAQSCNASLHELGDWRLQPDACSGEQCI